VPQIPFGDAAEDALRLRKEKKKRKEKNIGEEKRL
jgi:hypothetical protein